MFVFQLTQHYKIGIMYCRPGQATEEEMYNNGEILYLETLTLTLGSHNLF